MNNIKTVQDVEYFQIHMETIQKSTISLLNEAAICVLIDMPDWELDPSGLKEKILFTTNTSGPDYSHTVVKRLKRFLGEKNLGKSALLRYQYCNLLPALNENLEPYLKPIIGIKYSFIIP